MLAVLLLPLVAAAGVAFNGWPGTHDDHQLRDQLQTTSATALLTAQQLDALYNEMLKRLPQNGAISEADQRLLGTWLRFDDKFLAENAHNRDIRFETAVVRRRIGHVSLLLGDVKRAKVEFRSAIELLEQLAVEQPTVSSFIVEQAETHIRLGWALRQGGEFAEAADSFRQAARLASSERLAQDPGLLFPASLDPNLINVYVYDSLADWAWQRGGFEEAVTYRRQIVENLRLLIAQFPDVAPYQHNLIAAQSKFESTRQQALKQPAMAGPKSTPTRQRSSTDGVVEH